MKVYKRDARLAELKPYCYHAKELEYMEVTDWHNGEGFDVTINDEKRISLTHGEWACLQVLVNYKES
jgi:hypothetical protein